MTTKYKNNCCIAICKGERFDLAHKFPKSQERTMQWLNAIGCPALQDIPFKKLSNQYQVCSRHFRIEDYKHCKSRELNMNVVPSLNLIDLSQLHLSRAANDGNCKTALKDAATDESVQKDSIDNGGEMSTQNEHDIQNIDSIEMCAVSNQPLIRGDKSTNATVDPISMEEDAEISPCVSTFIEVTHPNYDTKFSLSSFWLRCHCPCSLCFDAKTHRRKTNPLDIPRQIEPDFVKQVNGLDSLSVIWNDGHQSTYDIDFLASSQTSEEHITYHRIPWHRDSESLQENKSLGFTQIVCQNKTQELFENLCQSGIAIVEDIPVDSKTMAAQLVLGRIFPQLKTVQFYESREIHTGICTNLSYSSADSGLKCFFVTEETGMVLVDGLNVSQVLRTTNAKAFQTLSQIAVPYEIFDNQVKWKRLAPIISLHPQTEEILQLCLDVHCLGTVNSLSQERAEEFYDSLRQLLQIIETKENHLVVNLKPGTLVILDNWRMLHKCLGTSGVHQHFVERKDFLSRIRYFKLTP